MSPKKLFLETIRTSHTVSFPGFIGEERGKQMGQGVRLRISLLEGWSNDSNRCLIVRPGRSCPIVFLLLLVVQSTSVCTSIKFESHVRF